MKTSLLFALLVTCQVCSASLTGPFVLWGTAGLRNAKVAAIQRLDDVTLRSVYAEAETIVVFVRNASLGPLRADAYPDFKGLLMKTDWTYLPQRVLTLDPLDFNGNAEIISLVGSPAQQDVEITALFNDAVNTYGAGKVLGILGNDGDTFTDPAATTRTHRRRREAPATAEPSAATSRVTTTTEEPSSAAVDGDANETMEENFVYIAPGKAMMYTTAPPQLADGSGTLELREHGVVTTDERKDELVRFIVTFKVPAGGKLVLRFRFPIVNGYWSLTAVELEESARAGGEPPRNSELLVVGEAPTAPLGFSYKCTRTLQFRLNSTVLTLDNIQVQPVLVDARAFSDAYDCVGFTSGGIMSGVFVSMMLVGVMTIGIVFILDIKTPNKFENNRGKQLTFTIQE